MHKAGGYKGAEAPGSGGQTACSCQLPETETAVAKLWKVSLHILIFLCDLWVYFCSRKTCGVLSERRVIMALLGDKKVKIGTSPTVRVAANLLIDQGSHLTHLNIIRYTYL